MDKENVKKYFNNLCSQEEEKAVECWFIDNVDNNELDTVLWEILASCPEESKEKTSEAYQKLCKRLGITTPSSKVRTLKHYFVRIAAILVVGFLGYTTYFFTHRNSDSSIEWVEVYAPNGETRSVFLPDSSLISLKAGSKLIYTKDFSSKSREVFLSGEAYAEISRDPDRPFTMHCNDVKVCVLGTRFNVQSFVEDSEIEIQLYEGSVRLESSVANQNDTTLMTLGDVVKIDRKTGKKTQYNLPVLSEQENSNDFYFIDKRLDNIVQQLGRSFDKQIVIKNPDLASTKYYAIFANNENLNQILNQLNTSKHMKITYVNDDLIYIDKNR